MPDKTKKLRLVFFIYWFLLAYILAALVWWFIALNRQNRLMTKYEMEQLHPADPGYEAEADSVRWKKESQRNTWEKASLFSCSS
jgi:hypothetical protein